MPYEHGIEIDGDGNVWVGGNNGDPSDDMLLKFTHEGELVMQIGGSGQSGGNTDTDNLKRPAEASVYPDTNEVFVADGYGNRRVIVLDAETGEYKRMWGAFGNEPIEASDEQPPVDEVLGPQQFGTVHGIEVSNDGLVYVSRSRPQSHSGLRHRRHLSDAGVRQSGRQRELGCRPRVFA